MLSALQFYSQGKACSYRWDIFTQLPAAQWITVAPKPWELALISRSCVTALYIIGEGSARAKMAHCFP